MSNVEPKVPNINPRQIGPALPRTAPRAGKHFAEAPAVQTGSGFGSHYAPNHQIATPPAAPSMPGAAPGPVQSGRVSTPSIAPFNHRNGMGTQNIEDNRHESPRDAIARDVTPGHPAAPGPQSAPSEPPMHDTQFGTSTMARRLSMFSDLAHGKNPEHIAGLAAGVHHSAEHFGAYQRAGRSLAGAQQQMQRGAGREQEHQARFEMTQQKHGWAGERHAAGQANTQLRGARQIQQYEHADELHPQKVRAAAAGAEAAEARAGVASGMAPHKIRSAAANATSAETRARAGAEAAPHVVAKAAAGAEAAGNRAVQAHAAASKSVAAAEHHENVELPAKSAMLEHHVRAAGHQAGAASERRGFAAARAEGEQLKTEHVRNTVVPASEVVHESRMEAAEHVAGASKARRQLAEGRLAAFMAGQQGDE